MRSGVLTALLGSVVVLVLGASPAEATTVTYSFGCITANSPTDCGIGEAQLTVDVSNEGVGANQAAFTFRNTGTSAASITDVYFDDGTLLGIASIINGPGVNFSAGASPGDLPGGNTIDPPFQATAGFTADSNSPAQPNGVNTGEFVTIIFNLINGKNYDDVIAALEDGTDLRIGIHVQGFDGGGSESFVTSVPEPGTMMLLGSGLLGLVAEARRRRRRLA